MKMLRGGGCCGTRHRCCCANRGCCSVVVVVYLMKMFRGGDVVGEWVLSLSLFVGHIMDLHRKKFFQSGGWKGWGWKGSERGEGGEINPLTIPPPPPPPPHRKCPQIGQLPLIGLPPQLTTAYKRHLGQWENNNKPPSHSYKINLTLKSKFSKYVY